MKLLSVASAFLLAGLATALPPACSNYRLTTRAPKYVKNGQSVTLTATAKNIGGAGPTSTMVLGFTLPVVADYVSGKATNNLAITVDDQTPPTTATITIPSFPQGKTFRLRIKAKVDDCADGTINWNAAITNNAAVCGTADTAKSEVRHPKNWKPCV